MFSVLRKMRMSRPLTDAVGGLHAYLGFGASLRSAMDRSELVIEAVRLSKRFGERTQSIQWWLMAETR